MNSRCLIRFHFEQPLRQLQTVTVKLHEQLCDACSLAFQTREQQLFAPPALARMSSRLA
jgi:NMD protein affecting ribosome stability and mRNA decay